MQFQVFERNKVIENKKVVFPTEFQNLARKTALKLSDSIGCGNKAGECITMDPVQNYIETKLFHWYTNNLTWNCFTIFYSASLVNAQRVTVVNWSLFADFLQLVNWSVFTCCKLNHSHKKQIVWKLESNGPFYALMLRTKLF